MQIDKNILAEKNYTGSRLIAINDPTILKLKKELNAFQKQANPFLKKMEALTPAMDPIYTRIGEHQAQIKKLHEDLAPFKEKYDIELKRVELIDQKAQLVKNKMQPLVNRIVESQLSEFEKATQLIEKNSLIYVEVVDEIEEKVKAIRASKAKK